MTQTKTISLKHNIDALIAGCIGAAIIYWFAVQHGIGISPDSVAYTSVARNMQHGKFWYQFDNRPLIIFPCFYPSFLGIAMLITQHDIVAIAPLLNALLFANVIFITGCIAQQMIISRWHKWLLLSSLIISSSLTEIYCMLWSETLFILLLLLLFIALRKYGSTYSKKGLLSVVAIAAVACITRFAGVTCIAITGFVILMDGNLFWRKKLGHLLALAMCSLLPLMANVFYNYYLEGTLTGIRQKSVTPFFTNLHFFGTVVLDWLHLPQGIYAYATVFGAIVLVAGIALIARYCLQQKEMYSYQNMATVGFTIYSAFIIITSSISRYEQINNRLLSAAYIPLLLTIGYWLVTAIKHIKFTGLKWSCIGACLSLVGWFQYQQYLWFDDWRGMVIDYGIPGYTDDSWQQSPIIHFLQTKPQHFKQQNIYSNACEAVYFYSGLNSQTLPETVHTQVVKSYYNTKPNYIVWFTNGFDNPDILRLTIIQQHRQLDTLKTFTDGYILMSSLKK